MSKVLVTGGNGQLAGCIKDVTLEITDHSFIFKDSGELDITNKFQIDTYFANERLDFCVNCAGYTAVDKAETESDEAKSVNTDGVRKLAEICAKYEVKLIHISTDFVFDGNTNSPYKEEDSTNPINVYGQTKLGGELAIKVILKQHFIIRTSWLYSEYGTNFMKTMLRLGAEQREVRVVDDQVGVPTYAADLANTILQIINKNTDKYGLYHFSNANSTSWFGFAAEIFKSKALKTHLIPITTKEYSVPAKRPAYSVLNTAKIKKTFDLKIPNWKDSLKECLNKLDKN